MQEQNRNRNEWEKSLAQYKECEIYSLRRAVCDGHDILSYQYR